MSTKRARNDGLEPRAVYPPGDVDAFNRKQPLDVVQPGAYLSGDVPQAIHEQLTSSPDSGWSLVNYTPPGEKQGKPADKEEGK